MNKSLAVLVLLVLSSLGRAHGSGVLRLKDAQVAAQVLDFVDAIDRTDSALCDLIMQTAPFDSAMQTQAMLTVWLAARLNQPGRGVCEAFGLAAADTLDTMRANHYPFDKLPVPYDTMSRQTAEVAYANSCHTQRGDGVLDEVTASLLRIGARMSAFYVHV